MKLTSRFRVFLLLPLLLFASTMSLAQTAKVGAAPIAEELSAEQQDALDLLKSLARSLKSEADKLTAGRLQARIADELWPLDEAFAREAFRWSFEAISQPVPDDLPKEKQPSYVNRQASALKEALRRFGKHDSKQAAAWLQAFENEMAAKNPSAKIDSSRLDLFMQIAAQLATTDPQQAATLGKIALSGNRIPEGFGILLFGLSRNSRHLSDDIFRAAIATLRRGNYVHDPALFSLTNYIFPNGEINPEATLADAQLLANYFVDGAWQQPGGDGKPVPTSSASFYNTLELTALPIVSRYAPTRLPELRGQMARIASGLSQEQAQRTEILRSSQQQQSTLANRNNYSLDEQIERAEKEKNVQVRDALLLSIVHNLVRQDSERALSLAKKIDNENLRLTAEDDVRLIMIQYLLRPQSIAEARKVSALFNNQVFRAKVLVQLAAKVWSSNKDQAQATEILSEALTVAAKADDVPDKVLALMQVVEQFAKFDSIRAFEVLGTALATMNRLKEPAPATSAVSKPPLLRIKSFTVINGIEMTAGNEATIDSIDFREVVTLATHDYMQTRLLATKLDQPVQRANYLTSVALSILKPVRLASSTRD